MTKFLVIVALFLAAIMILPSEAFPSHKAFKHLYHGFDHMKHKGFGHQYGHHGSSHHGSSHHYGHKGYKHQGHHGYGYDYSPYGYGQGYGGTLGGYGW